MKALILLLVFLLFSLSGLHDLKKDEVSFSILTIGNAHYKSFTTYNDISFSALSFRDCFKGLAKTYTLNSTINSPLSKSDILSAVRKFVNRLAKSKDNQQVGLIYYCGHGVTDKSGSMYFVPGDADKNLGNLTFDALRERLLNVDEINKIILDAKMLGDSSQYFIFGDCCSDKVSSSWYKGVGFDFNADGTGSFTYNLEKMDPNVRSMIEASVAAQFDSDSISDISNDDSTKINLNEGSIIPELVRAFSMKASGNYVFNSSAVGQQTEMVLSPRANKMNYSVGPICRRAVLYFDLQNQKRYLDVNVFSEFIDKLLQPGYDSLTAPTLINRSRN